MQKIKSLKKKKKMKMKGNNRLEYDGSFTAMSIMGQSLMQPLIGVSVKYKTFA